MVGVVNQFPIVGANFFGGIREMRQNRLAEAAARAQMAAAEAQRQRQAEEAQRQAEAEQAFGRLTSPEPAIGFDTGVAQGAMSQYTPQQRNQDLGRVIMGGMGQELQQYQQITSPVAAEIPGEVSDIAQNTAARIQQGIMDPQAAIENGWLAARQYGYRGSRDDFAVIANASMPEQPRMTALQQRAVDAGLQPGTPEYQDFMLRGGPERGPSSIDRLAAAIAGQGEEAPITDRNRFFATVSGPILEAQAAAGLRAPAGLARVNELRGLYEQNPGLYTGGLGEFRTNIASILQGLGVSEEDTAQIQDLAPAQAFRAIQNTMALELRNPESGYGLTGNTSNRDVQFLLASVPNLDNTPEANLAMLDIMELRYRQQQRIANIIFENAARNNGTPTTEVYREIENYLTSEENLQAVSELARGVRSALGQEENNPPKGFVIVETGQ